jgi:hypothetical protein
MPKCVDSNRVKMVEALRDASVTVTSLHAVGRGVPDLLVGFRGENYLLEVKSSRGKLTSSQEDWIQDWRGRVFIVRSVDDALMAVGVG